VNENEGTVPRAAKRGAAALSRVSRERCRKVFNYGELRRVQEYGRSLINVHAR